MKERKVWVLATNASGEPEFLSLRPEATDEQVDEGAHYDLAIAQAEDMGYEQPMIAFDETDPAGRLLAQAMGADAPREQGDVPGDADAPEWVVPLAVDMSMSASIKVRAQHRDAAVSAVQAYACNHLFDLFDLDAENYRGPCDFYVPDVDEVRQVDGEEASPAAA